MKLSEEVLKLVLEILQPERTHDARDVLQLAQGAYLAENSLRVL